MAEEPRTASLTFAAAAVGAVLPPLAFAWSEDAPPPVVWAGLAAISVVLSGLIAVACRDGFGERGPYAPPIAAGVLCLMLSAPLTLVGLLAGPAVVRGGLNEDVPPPPAAPGHAGQGVERRVQDSASR